MLSSSEERIKLFFQQRSEEADKLTLNISQLFPNLRDGDAQPECVALT